MKKYFGYETNILKRRKILKLSFLLHLLIVFKELYYFPDEKYSKKYLL
jgi:hypothetical protein